MEEGMSCLCAVHIPHAVDVLGDGGSTAAAGLIGRHGVSAERTKEVEREDMEVLKHPPLEFWTRPRSELQG